LSFADRLGGPSLFFAGGASAAASDILRLYVEKKHV
jgi:hypothetical protein